MSAALAAQRPLVALDVEPRLLRDALARALDDGGVTVVDLREGAEYDIILASEPSTAASGTAMVVPVGPDGSSEAGLLSVSDLLEVIHRWEPSAAG